MIKKTYISMAIIVVLMMSLVNSSALSVGYAEGNSNYIQLETSEPVREKLKLNIIDSNDEIDKVLVKGQNTIKNGDFTEEGENGPGTKYWEDGGFGLKNVMIENGAASVDTNRNVNTRFGQRDVLGSGLKDEYLVRVEAKGEGGLRARFSAYGGVNIVFPSPQELNDNYQTYEYVVKYREDLTNELRLELILGGQATITNVEMYETSEIEGDFVEIYDNGVYEFSIVKKDGSVASEQVEVTNIDNENPKLSITKDPDDWTNDKVSLNIDAKDEESGIDNIYITGEDTIRNGDFSELSNHWGILQTSDKSHSEFSSEGVHMIAKDEGKEYGLRLSQHDILGKGLKELYIVKVTAKGRGAFSARFSNGTNIVPKEIINSDEYREYDFIIEYGDKLIDKLRVDLIENGELWISKVEMYEMKEVVNNKVDVYENGEYEVVVIDKAGNSTSETVTVDNIDKKAPKVSLTQNPKSDSWTNDKVEVSVHAEDEGSGVESILVKGENLIQNGDFSMGLKNWISNNQSINDSWKIKDNSAYLKPNGKQMKAQMGYPNVIQGSIRDHFLIRVKAKGEGNLNTRFSIPSSDKSNYAQVNYINSKDYRTYEYVIDYNEKLKNELRLELVNEENGYENVNENHEVFISNVEMYELTTLESNSLDIYNNGKYEVIVTDKVGNVTNKKIEIDNIDKNSPTVSVEQDIIEKTHKNINLKVNAEDLESGVKRIMYIGEDMVEDGDFKSELGEYWNTTGDSIESGFDKSGVIEINDGVLRLADDNFVLNKSKQFNVFKDSEVGATYYAEIVARGDGILNSRFACGGFPDKYAQKVENESWGTYTFLLERNDESGDDLHVDKIGKVGDGSWIEVKNVKVFAQKDITDTRELEVTRNGVYTFVVEDNAGNITTVEHEVSNIERNLSLKGNNSKYSHKWTIGNKGSLSIDIDNFEITDWRDEIDNDYTLLVEADKLTHDNYVLKPGTVSIKSINNIKELNGDGSADFKKYGGVIDDGALRVLGAKDARGVFEIEFPKNALKFNIPDTVKRGSYNSKLTWTLEAGPEVN